jgi:hypothetical protein
VEYQASTTKTAKLCVQGNLPAPGTLKIQGNNSQINDLRDVSYAQSANPGCLNVEINCNQPNQTYILEVDFLDTEQQPLKFMIMQTA